MVTPVKDAGVTTRAVQSNVPFAVSSCLHNSAKVEAAFLFGKLGYTIYHEKGQRNTGREEIEESGSGLGINFNPLSTVHLFGEVIEKCTC